MFHYIISKLEYIFNEEYTRELLLLIKEVAELDKIIADHSEVQSYDQAAGPESALDNREKSDTYSNIAFYINDRWRAIVCKDGIQWILQVRKGYYEGRPAWRGVSYVRAKTGLRRAIREKVGNVSPESEAQLAQLPDRIES